MKIVRISAIWCTSCILTTKDFNDIKEKYKDIEYVELDYDTDDIDSYNPGDTLPIIIIFKDDKEVARIVGEKRFKEIDKVVEGLI